MATVEEIADELYRTDPDLFVAARTAAAATAKDTGDKALAKEVAALRKPTRSAWLVNLLARAYADRLEALSALAGRLAEATAEVDVAALRTLGAERTALVGALTRLAVDLGREAGYEGGEAARADVSTTLQAALADPEVLAQVVAGRLEKAQVYAGFGFPLLAEAPAAPAVPRAPSKAQTTVEVEEDQEDPAVVRALAEVERLTAQLAVEEAAREQAEDAKATADEALDRASQEVADLRAELKAAEAMELAARDAVTAASDDLHDARTAVQQTRAALEREKRALPGG